MRLKNILYLTVFFFCLTSCEEVIEIDLNEGDTRVVIEAQLSDLSNLQQIRVSQTVPFSEAIKSKAVDYAQVSVQDNDGRAYVFNYTGNGVYTMPDFLPVAGRSYMLAVKVGESLYSASCKMPSYVDVDSLGIVKEEIFKDDYYFATFKFNDPKDQDNYYKYDLSINQGAFKFSATFNDKFNNGLYVTHQVGDRDIDLVPGDSVTVRRYTVDKAVFKYWNEFQMTNPGNAAPGNPTSNISNSALGYFSVASGKEYGLRIE